MLDDRDSEGYLMVKGPVKPPPQLDLEDLVGSRRNVTSGSGKIGGKDTEKLGSTGFKDWDCEESGFIVVGEKLGGVMSSYTTPSLAQNGQMTLKRKKKTKEGGANLFSFKTTRK